MALANTHSNLAPFDGELYLLKQFYPLADAQAFYQRLSAELAWQTEQLFIYGRWVSVPRLMCWYGDAGAVYAYSHVQHHPLPWTPCLLALRAAVENTCGCMFNSVLGNLYRDGQDSMGCHADNEPELGLNPVIASLSFGEGRVLKFKHPATKTVVSLALEQGDLLIMQGVLQQHWQHFLPKTCQSKAHRINLTFRNIKPISR